MDTKTLVAALNKADPERNSSYQDRQVALKFAHRAMDESGLSYASLGFSQEDAERIENQFSVATGHEREGSSRTGYKHQWWNPFSWGGQGSQASSSQQATSQQASSSSSQGYTSSDYHSYDDPASPDYQFQVNYEVVEDYQGPVPYWDGGS
jgi:hypothetical protein